MEKNMEKQICVHVSTLKESLDRIKQLNNIEKEIGWRTLNKQVSGLDLSDGSMDLIDNLETRLEKLIKNGKQCTSEE